MKNKKLLSTFLTITLALSSTISVGVVVSEAKTSADFTDLKNLDEATKAKFDALIDAGIIDGVSEGTFGLKDEMNRAQFAKVAALIFGLKVDSTIKTSSFSDVKADDPSNGYALPYIEALKAAAITTGKDDGTFDPAGKVTKEQLAAFLVRGLGKDKEAKNSNGTGDPTVSNWAQGYVALALQMKLLETNSGGSFGGTQNANRDLLILGAYESKKLFEPTLPLKISGGEFKSGNKLELTLTTQVDLASIDLSKITVNGVPLDSSLDSFELSEDKKTIIIKLHNGFQLDSTKTPVIVVNGLKTLFGNELKNDGEVPIPVKVTEPPYTPIPILEQPSIPKTEQPVEQPDDSNEEQQEQQPNNPNPEQPVEQPDDSNEEQQEQQPNNPNPEQPVEQPDDSNEEQQEQQPNNPNPEQPVEQPDDSDEEQQEQQPNNPNPEQPVEQPND